MQEATKSNCIYLQQTDRNGRFYVVRFQLRRKNTKINKNLVSYLEYLDKFEFCAKTNTQKWPPSYFTCKQISKSGHSAHFTRTPLISS